MKEVGRSVHSLDVVKKKSSSGCLIIKKKVVDGDVGVKGFSDSPSRNLFISKKEKKRPRVITSDSESSDEFTEPYRRKFDKSHSGLGFSNGGFVSYRESDPPKRVNNGIDSFEFDAYDGLHERKVRKDVYDRLNSNWRNGDQKDYGSGSSSTRRIYDNRRDFVHDSRSTILGAKGNRFNHGVRSHYEMEDEEPRVPHSVLSERYREVSDEPIRLQGKNGVLKVMVKKHKQISVPHKSYDLAEPEEWKESRPEAYKKKQLNLSHKSLDHWEASNKKKAAMGSSLYPALKKPVSSKSKEKSDSDTSLPVKTSNVRHSSTEKLIKSENKLSVPMKNVAPVKVKESKVKRGSGTEKQLLREKIRSMLLSAGWTIDYRPRRNRDYLDAVYINPSGTAYWSIIKAYEALQKEEKDHSQVGGDFTPLPVETLSKLTRQTRKKIEREMKKKRRDEGKYSEGAETTKRRLEDASQDSGDDSNDNYSREKIKKRNFGVNSRMVQERNSNKYGRCTLLIRSEGKKSANDRFVPYSGKRTLLSWLIDSGIVQMSEKVQYMNQKKTRVMQEGWITKEGIHCGCCSKILTVLKFELHAGSKLREPFPNIYVQSGKSLTECLIDAWDKQGELERKGFHAVDVNGEGDGDDPNDDTCGLCGDGGDLICCDGCPSTFHQSCLGIQMLPQGDWHCPNCSCKYCEMATGAGVRTESTLLVCCLCQKKYHKSCSPEMDNKPIDPTDSNLSFCGHKCLELYSHLQKLVGARHELDSGFSWSLIHRSDVSLDNSSIESSQRVECNSKLAVALSVIDECFMPIVDRRSGINLIHNVVYNCGSNFSRLNYSGFFTAILERGDEIICAASIRIHGTQLAEMPFIGTRHIHRRQGMCRQLLSAIESALSFLHIEKLIIPAVSEHIHTWTDVFGFSPLDESQKQELRSINMLVFPGINLLHKPLNKAASIKMGKSQPNSPDDKLLSEKVPPTVSGSQNSPVKVAASIKMEKLQKNSPDDELLSEKIPPTGSYSQDSPVKDDLLLPVSTRNSKVVSDSIVQFDDDDDTVMHNGEVGTQNLTHADSIEAKDGDADCMPPKESVSVDAQSDSNGEEFVAKNARNESVSVPADSDSNIQITDAQNDNTADAIPPENSDSNIQVIDVQNADMIPLENSDSNTHVTDVQNGETADALPPENSDSNTQVTDVQNRKSADVIPPETRVLNDVTSSDVLCEPKPQL